MKTLTVYGNSIDIITEYVKEILEDAEDGKDTITIYENNNGYWNTSKEKKPRALESVILKEDLIQSVLDDVQDFIDS